MDVKEKLVELLTDYGYIDKMTDELLPECKECRSHVSKAQDDLDKFYGRTDNGT